MQCVKRAAMRFLKNPHALVKQTALRPVYAHFAPLQSIFRIMKLKSAGLAQEQARGQLRRGTKLEGGVRMDAVVLPLRKQDRRTYG